MASLFTTTVIFLRIMKNIGGPTFFRIFFQFISFFLYKILNFQILVIGVSHIYLSSFFLNDKYKHYILLFTIILFKVH